MIALCSCDAKVEFNSDMTKPETTTSNSKDSDIQSNTSQLIEETPTSEFEFEYNSEYDGMQINKYTGNSSIVVIPRIIGTTPVVTIGEKAFFNCNTVEQIIVPKTVKNLQVFSFARCTNLKSVNIESNETDISDYAFYDSTSLNTVAVPPDFRGKVGVEPFYNCTQMTNIAIPGYDSESSNGIPWKIFKCTEQFLTDMDTKGLGMKPKGNVKKEDKVLLKIHISGMLDKNGELVYSAEITNDELEKSYDERTDIWRKRDNSTIKCGEDLKKHFEDWYIKRLYQEQYTDDEVYITDEIIEISICGIDCGTATLISQ